MVFFFFFIKCLLSQVLLSWSWGKALLKCLKVLVFRVLSCVSFSFSKLLLLERLSVMFLKQGRKYVCFKGSCLHQRGLSKGIFWRLLSWHMLLLLIHAWSLIICVCSLERRTKAQGALEYNQSLLSVWTCVAFVDPWLILDPLYLWFDEKNKSSRCSQVQPKLPFVWPFLMNSHLDFNAWEL